MTRAPWQIPGDALALACSAWQSSPHEGHGTLDLRLTRWFNRLVAEVAFWEEATT